MSSRAAQAIRFKGRSYFSLTMSPDAPLEDWIQRLDGWLERSPSFFTRNAVILDVRDLGLDLATYRQLLADLRERGIRVLGVDGADESWTGDDLPPMVPTGRDVRPQAASDVIPDPAPGAPTEPPAAVSGEHETAGWGRPLYIDAPIRSGQRVVYPDGDIIVMGSVSSGAEVIAGGSIHVYGALRGRAMAGAYGDDGGKIFCRSLEAELLAVNGLYQTAEEIDPALSKKPARVWLADGMMHVSRFD